MLLYHGTSESAARRILAEGILPRHASGHEGHWRAAPSHPDRAYLTRCYAPYYAFCATSGTGERWGLVEVDLEKIEPYRLRPDEDLFAQAAFGCAMVDLSKLPQVPKKHRDTAHAAAAYARDHLVPHHPHLYAASLELLGTLSVHGGVPASAIRRVALVDPKANPRLLDGAEPTISVLNHLLCGDGHAALTRFAMGEAVEPHQILAVPQAYELMAPEHREILAQQVAAGSGAEILYGPAWSENEPAVA